MVGQAEVVVGAHVDDSRAVLESDYRLLWGCDGPLLFEEPRFTEFTGPGFELREKCCVHIASRVDSIGR